MWQKAPSSILAVTNIRFYVCASGTGTGNGRTGAPCSILVPDLLHLRQLVGSYGKTAVVRDHDVPHTIASNITTRQLRSHPFTSIHSNSTTPCPKLRGPTLVKVCCVSLHRSWYMRHLRFPRPGHEALRCHLESSSRLMDSTYAHGSSIAVK